MNGDAQLITGDRYCHIICHIISTRDFPARLLFLPGAGVWVYVGGEGLGLSITSPWIQINKPCLTIRRVVRFLYLEPLKEIENYRKLGSNNVIDIFERPEIETVITVIFSIGEVRFPPFQIVNHQPLEFGAKHLLPKRHLWYDTPPAPSSPLLQRTLTVLQLLDQRL